MIANFSRLVELDISKNCELLNYMYIHTCTYVHVHVHVHIQTYTYMYMYMVSYRNYLGGGCGIAEDCV